MVASSANRLQFAGRRDVDVAARAAAVDPEQLAAAIRGADQAEPDDTRFHAHLAGIDLTEMAQPFLLGQSVLRVDAAVEPGPHDALMRRQRPRRENFIVQQPGGSNRKPPSRALAWSARRVSPAGTTARPIL